MPKKKTTEHQKKLKRMKIKANKLYKEMTTAMKEVNSSAESFYKRSIKYAKLLKKIEEEIIKNHEQSKRNINFRSKKTARKGRTEKKRS